MPRKRGSVTLQRASQEVKEAQMFREKMGHVSEWMARAQLPRNVKEKIRAYYAEVLVCHLDSKLNAYPMPPPPPPPHSQGVS